MIYHVKLFLNSCHMFGPRSNRKLFVPLLKNVFVISCVEHNRPYFTHVLIGNCWWLAAADMRLLHNTNAVLHLSAVFKKAIIFVGFRKGYRIIATFTNRGPVNADVSIKRVACIRNHLHLCIQQQLNNISTLVWQSTVKTRNVHMFVHQLNHIQTYRLKVNSSLPTDSRTVKLA